MWLDTMTGRIIIIVAVWAACLPCLGGSTGSQQAPLSDAGLVVPLPALATVVANDLSGKTWQQSGTLGGSLEVACGDIRQSLRAGGWKMDKVIALGEGAHRSELTLWLRRNHRILVMVWEKEAGLCGFSWGEER